MPEVADAYRQCRERISELVADLSDSEAGRPVPSCPEWTVSDVVAHVVGVVDDALNGRLDGVATPPWTQAQVDARRQRRPAELIEEWSSIAPAFESLLDSIGPPGRQAVGDLVTHEHDLRGAIGRQGARDTDAVGIGLGFMAAAFVAAAAERDISVAVLTAGGQGFGPDEAVHVLRAPDFELLRAVTGRRSAAQICRMRWTGDPEAVLPAFSFGPFRPSAADIDE